MAHAGAGDVPEEVERGVQHDALLVQLVRDALALHCKPSGLLHTLEVVIKLMRQRSKDMVIELGDEEGGHQAEGGET